PRISFELVEPAQVDPIARVRLFRATDPARALSLRTMDMIADVDLATATRTADGLILIDDDFANDAPIPYGDPLSYRLAWVREVHYSDPAGNAKMADVPSQPSRAFSAELIDVVNPAPPLPVVTAAPAGSPGERMVTISWSPTRHNATYYISRLDASGVWTRLGEVKTNEATASFALADALPIADEDGAPIFYRFAIDAVGPSDLVNVDRAPVTVKLDFA
ncbi:MAG: hypothetical protein QOJ27_135, partial [Sphingomonadales bacterium]|nr:hypothetical protein [Sphingomonadales bacterium]